MDDALHARFICDRAESNRNVAAWVAWIPRPGEEKGEGGWSCRPSFLSRIRVGTRGGAMDAWPARTVEVKIKVENTSTALVLLQSNRSTTRSHRQSSSNVCLRYRFTASRPRIGATGFHLATS